MPFRIYNTEGFSGPHGSRGGRGSFCGGAVFRGEQVGARKGRHAGAQRVEVQGEVKVKM